MVFVESFGFNQLLLRSCRPKLNSPYGSKNFVIFNLGIKHDFNFLAINKSRLFSSEQTPNGAENVSGESKIPSVKTREGNPHNFFEELIEKRMSLLPDDVHSEKLELLSARYNLAKSQGSLLDQPDLLWLMLSNIRLNNINMALVYFQDLVEIEELDVKYYELLMIHLAHQEKHRRAMDIFQLVKKKFLERKISKPSQDLFDVAFMLHRNLGDINMCLEDYELLFKYQYLPRIQYIEVIIRLASVAADLHTFNFFYTRLSHKKVKLDKQKLKEIMSLYGTNRNHLKDSQKKKVSTNDFCVIVDAAMRVHNFKLAHDLILECRDSYKILPDSKLYETFLNGCIRDNHLRDKARKWKKIFKKYPKQVQNREDHYNFAYFLKELELTLADSMSNAQVRDAGDTVKFSRTTRKQSKKLYKYFPKIRWNLLSFETPNLFEYVPSYIERRKLAGLIHEQENITQELESIQKEASTEIKLANNDFSEEISNYLSELIKAKEASLEKNN